MINEKKSHADLVISGKSIYDGVQDKTTSGAIAIAGNKVIKLGAEEEVKPYITRATKQYRFENQLIFLMKASRSLKNRQTSCNGLNNLT